MKLVAFISLKTEERKLHNETVFNMFWVHIYIRSNIIKSGKISTHHAIQLKLFFTIYLITTASLLTKTKYNVCNMNLLLISRVKVML